MKEITYEEIVCEALLEFLDESSKKQDELIEAMQS